ncbi:hypothetical protein [Flavobacterium ammonificans]|uniref:Uncharacterized protein n=1 Tax=Flavobacterium ammonificans TaxID=1751056 RepID=A0ABM7UXD3_9FLAO|nr:hypothetical protein [Flavobacterium ammonificans]BDB52022.1 hypothetical protein GENT11_03340 [Flavobacterium ammonificans]
MKFSNKEIDNLSRTYNHKIEFDGYDFWWYSYKKDKWELHCIKPFKNYSKAIEYIKFWLNKYVLMISNDNESIDKITNDVIDQVRIYDIVNSNMKTIDKIFEIYTIKPFLSQIELGEYLNISKMAISKQLKKVRKS